MELEPEESEFLTLVKDNEYSVGRITNKQYFRGYLIVLRVILEVTVTLVFMELCKDIPVTPDRDRLFIFVLTSKTKELLYVNKSRRLKVQTNKQTKRKI